MAEVVRHYQDDGAVILSLDNLITATWFAEPTLGRLRALYHTTKSVKAKNPKGCAYAGLIIGGTPRFSAEVRNEAKRITAHVDHRDLAAAHIILIDGLIGSAVRGFLGATVLLGRPKEPTKVFSNISDAVRWLAPLLRVEGAPQWSIERLTSHLESARLPPDKYRVS